MAKVRIKLNSPGVAALLTSEAVGAHIEGIARSRAPEGTVVSRIVGKTRANVRIEDPARDALDRDAKTGHLTRALGGGS